MDEVDKFVDEIERLVASDEVPTYSCAWTDALTDIISRAQGEAAAKARAAPVVKTTAEARQRCREHVRAGGYDLSTHWLLDLLDDADTISNAGGGEQASTRATERNGAQSGDPSATGTAPAPAAGTMVGACLELVRRRPGDYCTLRRGHAGEQHGHPPAKGATRDESVPPGFEPHTSGTPSTQHLVRRRDVICTREEARAIYDREHGYAPPTVDVAALRKLADDCRAPRRNMMYSQIADRIRDALRGTDG